MRANLRHFAEYTIAVAIIAVVVALLWSGTRWKGSGHVTVTVRLESPPPTGARIDFGVVNHHHLDIHRDNEWHDVDWWSAAETGGVWKTDVLYDVSPGPWYEVTRDLRFQLFRDTVVVRYSDDEAVRIARFRFEKRKGIREVQITVPGEPPGDAEVVGKRGGSGFP